MTRFGHFASQVTEIVGLLEGEPVPSPFGEPHAIARRAAEETTAWLARESGLPMHELGEPGRGKMFGVLVVRDRDGAVGYLRAFSGMLFGEWVLPGFVPPLFVPAERDAFWPAAEAELDALEAERQALIAAEGALGLHALDAAQQAERQALRAVHAARKAERHAARAGDADRHALAQASRADTAELRRLDAAHAAQRAPLAAEAARLVDTRTALERRRTARSRELWAKLYAGYVVENARGERIPLDSLYAVPPGGAGDCAGPKLLGHAYREGLTPIAFAEWWWGAPPLAGGRLHGVYYPACRGKCGVLLPAMMTGLAVARPPLPGETPPDTALRVVFEDDWLLVVDKPIGLLSVPGRHDRLRDSVLLRVRERLPSAAVVHRLDLDTSGLLLLAKDETTYVELQRLFARRAIDKRYVAVLDGEVAGDRGQIDLPVRVDLLDRPRQIHDPAHGKAALTEWEVVARAPGETRIAFWPRTGRTHQLRVHAAHPQGLGVPIRGDRLYGRPADRLYLHAESLAFDHPRTGARVALTSPPRF
jgi:tRNA pseudouridine32 synthase / 23S rRNA pseudouridine746 synthase